jgi:hypothetical protein
LAEPGQFNRGNARQPPQALRQPPATNSAPQVTRDIAVKHATGARRAPARRVTDRMSQLWAAKDTANLRTKAAQIGLADADLTRRADSSLHDSDDHFQSGP